MSLIFGPRVTGKDVFIWAILAGVIGEIYLEAVAWGLYPRILGVPMRPHILVMDLSRNVLSYELNEAIAFAIHLFIGVVLFPWTYLFARYRLGIGPGWLVAAMLGVGYWLIAQSTLAPLVGRPAFLGFIKYTWGSLFAHTSMLLVIAFAFEKLSGGPTRR